MNRRLPQLPLTSVPIDIKAFGKTFFLLAVDPRGEKTDYLVVSLARNLDKIRITIDGAPQIFHSLHVLYYNINLLKVNPFAIFYKNLIQKNSRLYLEALLYFSQN